MIDIKPSIALEDSKGIRYFFYYRDSSIYYREVSGTGDTKDTILISQVNTDFAAAIAADDTVYLACNSRYKGLLLFTYTNLGWKFETVVNLHNSSNIYIMDMTVQGSFIHIFFSKKLPIANMYNVYHLFKDVSGKVPYVEFSWMKNSLSEIYSQNIDSSYSVLPTKGGVIHYVSVWYDGTHYYITYYCFDESIKSWIHKSLNISYSSHISVKLAYHNKKLHLLCFSSEGEVSGIHHFISRSSGSSEIDFKEINNVNIDTGGAVPLFYVDDKALQLAWIKDDVFHQYSLDDSSGRWKKVIDLPFTTETNLNIIKNIRNTGTITATKGYFLLDKNYNLCRPIERPMKVSNEEQPNAKPQSSDYPEMSEYLKEILSEIKELSENVRSLTGRIDILENRTAVNIVQGQKPAEAYTVKPKTVPNADMEKAVLKKSRFKEKFMKSEKAPSYENLLSSQDNINTFVGKQASSPANSNPPVSIKPDDEKTSNDKQAFAAPNSTPLQNNEEPYKYNNLFKKIEDFFK